MSTLTDLNSFIKECNDSLFDKGIEENVNAMDYLQFRGITEETIRLNNIGYCPVEKAIPESILYFGAELKYKNPEDRKSFNGLSYFISGRLIVPVYDEFGICVGFATRKPTFKSGETWWNLPSPFYKGKHLFLLSQVKQEIISKNKVYLVEGYMDALYLCQAGLKNTTSIMGTALTMRKIGLVARYASNVCICFDVDKNSSGQIASKKAICQLYKLNFCENISVIDTLPVGVDPDDYVKKNGLDAFLKHERVLDDYDINLMCKELADEETKRKDEARKKYISGKTNIEDSEDKEIESDE